jgi:REP element-mobilizing transposase RayT
MYHIVCPTKYRLVIFDERADLLLKEICLEIEKRYEIIFLEIGADKDHVHFLVQSVPMYSPKKIVQTIKSIVARKMFERMPEIKKSLWGGEFWSKGYFVSTIGKHGNESKTITYIKNQGKAGNGYKVMHKIKQLTLFSNYNND